MLPSLTWNLDPVAVKFPPFALQPVALVVGVLGGLSALFAWRKSRRGIDDKGGVSFGIMILVAGVMAALVWPDAHPTIELRYYSLLFVVVFLVGYAFLNWQIRRGGGGVDEAGDFIVYGVVGVLAGARLGHVLFYDLEKAIDDPVWIFKIWTGGLSSHGATVGLIIAMYLFTRVRGIPFLEGSDRFSFSAATGATLVRVGNFFNSEIVGRKTDGTWGVRFPRFDCPAVKADPDCVAPLRHPTQLYEGGLALFTLLVLLVADRAMGKEKRPRGALIALFFAVYFTGRLGIEFTKEYQVVALEGTFTMGQYLSLVPALLGWYGLWWSFKKKLPVGWAPAEPEEEEEDEEEDEEEGRGRRLYDPDVEEVFGGRRGKRPERKRRRRAVEERRARDDEEEDEDEDRAAEAEAAPAPEAAPVRRRKKRRKQPDGASEPPAPKKSQDDDEDDEDDEYATAPRARLGCVLRARWLRTRFRAKVRACLVGRVPGLRCASWWRLPWDTRPGDVNQAIRSLRLRATSGATQPGKWNAATSIQPLASLTANSKASRRNPSALQPLPLRSSASAETRRPRGVVLCRGHTARLRLSLARPRIRPCRRASTHLTEERAPLRKRPPRPGSGR